MWCTWPTSRRSNKEHVRYVFTSLQLQLKYIYNHHQPFSALNYRSLFISASWFASHSKMNQCLQLLAYEGQKLEKQNRSIVPYQSVTFGVLLRTCSEFIYIKSEESLYEVL